MKEKKCALCDNSLQGESLTSLCNDCLKNADCCTGLEKIDGL